MKKKDLMHFEKKLLAEKQKILKQRGHTNEVLKQPQREAGGEISGYRTHIADQSSETFQRELASQLTSQESMTLAEIDAALKKIQNGHFGICEMCQGNVPKARLEILPYARLCIKCKRKGDSK
ncbi:MAG: TraR/DksA family transcriptional regulator [bacterium]|nr:TraR/DksA family transcriptional regulator [candidate division WOR-3 bacterium]MDH5682910.1 TraR/DksA family transcriptional regulator [candidate division WOR-3 bacterium]